MIFCQQVDEWPVVRPAELGVGLARVGVWIARQHRREVAGERRLLRRISDIPHFQVVPKRSLLDLDPDAPPELIFDIAALVNR
jgi:hypothetical protein